MHRTFFQPCVRSRSKSVTFNAVGSGHHGGCVYEVSFAFKHWCLRNRAKRTNLMILLTLTQGPSCSKLMMLLVNIPLKLWPLNVTYADIFAEKNVSSKSYSHFSNKNTCELDIVFTRTRNILTTNELLNLTMLWTRPRTPTLMQEGDPMSLLLATTVWI